MEDNLLNKRNKKSLENLLSYSLKLDVDNKKNISARTYLKKCENSLKSFKRIDQAYKKGKTPELEYNELVKEYLKEYPPFIFMPKSVEYDIIEGCFPLKYEWGLKELKYKHENDPKKSQTGAIKIELLLTGSTIISDKQSNLVDKNQYKIKNFYKYNLMFHSEMIEEDLQLFGQI